MAIEDLGFTELENSGDITGDKNGFKVVRRFGGPWSQRTQFLRYVFGYHDALGYQPPVSLNESGHTLYPKSFRCTPDGNQPVAKITDVGSIYWGPGKTDDGETEADDENTAWGCCTIEITWSSPSSGGYGSQTSQDGVTVQRQYRFSTEAQEVPGRAWKFASGTPSAGTILSPDTPQHILINVAEVDVTLNNMRVPPWASIFGLAGHLNNATHEGFAAGALQYLGAEVGSGETPWGDVPLWTVRLQYVSKTFRGSPIFNKSFDVAAGDFYPIISVGGNNPPFPSGDLSALYA